MDDIEAALGAERDKSASEARRFKQAERWRSQLLEDDETFARFVEEHGADEAKLRQHVDDARHERDRGKPRGAGKALFRYVRDSLDVSPPARQSDR